MPKQHIKRFMQGRFLSPFFGSQGGYQRKLLGSFLLVSVVLFFVFSFLVLHASDKRYREEINHVGQQAITQARNTSDTLLMDVFSYGLQSITHDTDLTRWMYTEQFNVNDSILANSILSDFQRSNSYADSFYIFNFSNKRVLTKAGSIWFSSFYDQELLEFVTELKPSSIPVRYTPRIATLRDAQGHITQEKVWTLIFRQAYGGALALDINYEDYIELLNIQTDSEYIDSWVINENGLVLVGAEDEQFGTDMTDDPLLQAVRARPEREGSFQFQDPRTRESSTIYFIQNAYLGFTYISAVHNPLFGAENELFLIILGWSAVFLLLSAIGSILLAGLVYRPVKELSEVLNLDAPTHNKDEFDVFREAYVSMRESNDVLRSKAEAWRNAEEQKMLLKWIEPDAVTKRFNTEQYEAIENYFCNLYYRCVLFHIDPSEIYGTPEDMGLLKYSITNMIEELAEGFFLLRLLDYSANQVVCICNFEDQDREALHNALTTIQNVLNQHFNTVATVTVGVTVNDTSDLPQSFQSAKQALDRRFSYGSGTLTFCDDMMPVSAEDSVYPQEQEAQLLSSTRSGDSGEAYKQLSTFFEQIRAYQKETILLYLLQLDLALQKLEEVSHLDQQPLDLTQVYTASMTLDQLKGQFEARITCVADLVQSMRESNTDKLIARVNGLVENNLCNPNLTAAWVADEVDLSVNYLRNIYKESTGESLSAHITSAKIRLICDMLQTSDLSIQEISEKLGFTTHNYFFTFFKKHMGVTPKQYRLSKGSLRD